MVLMKSFVIVSLLYLFILWVLIVFLEKLGEDVRVFLKSGLNVFMNSENDMELWFVKDDSEDDFLVFSFFFRDVWIILFGIICCIEDFWLNVSNLVDFD